MATYVPTAANAATIAYAPKGGTASVPSTAGAGGGSWAGQRGVRREPVAQGPHRRLHVGQLTSVRPSPQGGADQRRDLDHLGLAHARRRLRCASETEAGGHKGRPGIVGNRIAVQGDPRLVEDLLRLLARE